MILQKKFKHSRNLETVQVNYNSRQSFEKENMKRMQKTVLVLRC